MWRLVQQPPCDLCSRSSTTDEAAAGPAEAVVADWASARTSACAHRAMAPSVTPSRQGPPTGSPWPTDQEPRRQCGVHRPAHALRQRHARVALATVQHHHSRAAVSQLPAVHRVVRGTQIVRMRLFEPTADVNPHSNSMLRSRCRRSTTYCIIQCSGLAIVWGTACAPTLVSAWWASPDRALVSKAEKTNPTFLSRYQ